MNDALQPRRPPAARGDGAIIEAFSENPSSAGRHFADKASGCEPAAARLAVVFGAKLDHGHAKAIAARLYAVLDAYLARESFLAGEAPSIADIALYSYTAHAPEGGVSLETYAHLCDWLARIEALPGFIPMRRTPVRATA